MAQATPQYRGTSYFFDGEQAVIYEEEDLTDDCANQSQHIIEQPNEIQ